MRKRVRIALAVLLVILAGVIGWQVFHAFHERRPVYQGKQLGFWLESLCIAMTQGNQDDGDRARQAIQHIGTNALPVLVERVRAQDTRLKELLMTWAQKQRLVHFHFKSADQRRVEAVLGYSALGQLATPSLIDTLTNDPSPCARRAAALALGHIGPTARLAAPALFRATKDTDQYVRINAFGALRRILPDPQITIPILVVGLDDPFPFARGSAASALGEYGQQARAALPALLRMLATNNSAGLVHDAAAAALKKIDPEAASKAGVR